jgi:ureidoglycolate hydrolase
MKPDSWLKSLPAQDITVENFQPYGQVIFANQDGEPYGPEDAQLVLDRGIPRFYIMRLFHRGRRFEQITRHRQCTQCLGSLGGKEWLIAVAPPSSAPEPGLDTIAAFRVPGDCFIKLELGTWHAGPYFDADWVDFYNLELSNTNSEDHDTCSLTSHQLTLEII